MSGNVPNVCPILTEFAGWYGFPTGPILPERYSYHTSYRLNTFREVLDLLSSAAAKKGFEVNPETMRFVAAFVALRGQPYEPKEPPAFEAEPEPELAGGAE